MSIAASDAPRGRIDVTVAAFVELLHAPALAVVCRFRPTGDIIAVNTYTEPIGAMFAVWACHQADIRAEVLPTSPLTKKEAAQ